MVRADHADEVPQALAALDRAQADGLWIAGYASYELGYALEPRLRPLMPQGRALPLLEFGLYHAPQPAEELLAQSAAAAAEAMLAPATPGWTGAEHGAALGRILDYIGAGDIYQANLTMPMRAEVRGTALGLYGALRARQRVGQGAFVDFAGTPTILSRSPELFFATDSTGRIETRPMKGTAPRATNPAHDAALKMGLQTSLKDRAENLMIVDLLRNDISRICRPGSVKVPQLYHVETYATVHQMVSHVVGDLLPGTPPSALFRALFPCGSITGAPKIRAMEIIRALEPQPRDIYCGAIGWMAPDGSSSFNVAIRTLMMQDGIARFGVGGGIVADSTPQGEYEEALWKARFAILS